MQVRTHARTDTKYVGEWNYTSAPLYIPTWGGKGQFFLYIKIEIKNFLGIVKWLATKNMLQYMSKL